MNLLAPLGCLAQDLSSGEVGRRRFGPPRDHSNPGWRRPRAQLEREVTTIIIAEEYQFVICVDTHVASHAFAGVDAVNGAVTSQDEFPATGTGVARAAAWVARRTGQPGEVLVVGEAIGSHGARCPCR